MNDDQRDWELKRDLGIVLTDQDERDVKPEKKDFKVQEGVYKQIPCSVRTLIPVSKNLVVVLGLVRDQLVHLAALELHLLLVERIFDRI